MEVIPVNNVTTKMIGQMATKIMAKSELVAFRKAKIAEFII